MKKTLSLSVLVVLLCESVALGQTVDPRVAQGRTLSTNCMQCHGVNGMPKAGGIDSLGGKSYNDLKNSLSDFAKKTPAPGGGEIMIVHAKTYTTEEIDAIAYFLSLK